MIKKSVGAAMAVAVASASLATTAAVPVQAKVIKVCVKKSTGEMRMLTKKKCKKGWKKQTWNNKGATGPKGDTGAQGPNLMVKDGNGNVLGKYLGAYPGAFGVYTVEINGGAYTFMANGRLYGFGTPNFKTNTCTGTAYIPVSSATEATLFTGMTGGPTRLVYRVTDPSFGPAKAWAPSTTTEVVNQNIYELDDTGACVLDGLHNGTLVALQEVAAPADATPPLTIQ